VLAKRIYEFLSAMNTKNFKIGSGRPALCPELKSGCLTGFQPRKYNSE